MVYDGVDTSNNDGENVLHDTMKLIISLNNIIISNHTGARMFERNVSTDDLISLITNGEIID